MQRTVIQGEVMMMMMMMTCVCVCWGVVVVVVDWWVDVGHIKPRRS